MAAGYLQYLFENEWFSSFLRSKNITFMVVASSKFSLSECSVFTRVWGAADLMLDIVFIFIFDKGSIYISSFFPSFYLGCKYIIYLLFSQKLSMFIISTWFWFFMFFSNFPRTFIIRKMCMKCCVFYMNDSPFIFAFDCIIGWLDVFKVQVIYEYNDCKVSLSAFSL